MRLGQTYQEGKFKKKSAVVKGKRPPKNTWEIRILGRSHVISAKRQFTWSEIEEEKKKKIPAPNKGHQTIEEILEKRRAKKGEESKAGEERGKEHEEPEEPTNEELIKLIGKGSKEERVAKDAREQNKGKEEGREKERKNSEERE